MRDDGSVLAGIEGRQVGDFVEVKVEIGTEGPDEALVDAVAQVVAESVAAEQIHTDGEVGVLDDAVLLDFFAFAEHVDGREGVADGSVGGDEEVSFSSLDGVDEGEASAAGAGLGGVVSAGQVAGEIADDGHGEGVQMSND